MFYIKSTFCAICTVFEITKNDRVPDISLHSTVHLGVQPDNFIYRFLEGKNLLDTQS
jgi:hypothetical protein